MLFEQWQQQFIDMQYCKVMFCRVCRFRVRVRKSYRTYRSSGYGYGSVTELTEVLGTGMNALQNLHKFFVGYRKAVPVPRVLCHGLAELTEVPGTGMNALQNSQNFRVRV